jgi:electron transfer flavoprotein beta subunit
MNIVVCVKHVPEISETDIVIDESGKNICTEDLVFNINEWDNYALEEAARIKESLGGDGTITVVTLGPEESQETLRRCQAMGADEALHLSDPAFFGGDPYAVARALHAALKEKSFDLLLTGVQAGDDGCGQVGPMLAELFHLPHATLVNKVTVEDGKVQVHRELEGGMAEIVSLELPAVLTIQTGINEPRYVSITAIRKAKSREIRELNHTDISLAPEDCGPAGSLTELKELFVPSSGKLAEILQGSPYEVSLKVIGLLKEKGGL